MQVLHNPRCGKSRNCLAFLQENNIDFEIIEYLKNPLNADDLKELLRKLDIKPIELVRQKESVWTEKFKDKKMTDGEIINAMAEFPILIERPIVISGDKAIVGRDIGKLKSFI